MSAVTTAQQSPQFDWSRIVPIRSAHFGHCSRASNDVGIISLPDATVEAATTKVVVELVVVVVVVAVEVVGVVVVVVEIELLVAGLAELVLNIVVVVVVVRALLPRLLRGTTSRFPLRLSMPYFGK